MIHNQNINLVDLKICSRCIYDERVASISFDQDGVCNYCHQVDDLKSQFGTGSSKGEEKLKQIIEEIKFSGKGKKYDCVVGVSGGTDSSYMLYLAIKWGLRPLAVHYDNTWNSAIATENIRKALSKLNVDLYTTVVDNKESDDIFKSFFFASVAEIEAATDLALAETMYRAAAKYKIKHVLEGHSFITEGISPLGRNYFDGKYIQSIHKIFGKLPLKTYPLMTFWRFLYSILFLNIKKIRPYWYITYSKEEARAFLEKEYGWQYYGGHHLENRMTAFFHSYYMPVKFNTDFRNNTLAALVRNGKLSREEAWKEYNTEPHLENELLSYFKKRLEISDEEFDRIMALPPKSWKEFPTYKRRFEILRPLFSILAKKNLVPMSFYLKYCFPIK
jgi:N-acetyl sugar amidotransferase